MREEACLSDRKHMNNNIIKEWQDLSFIKYRNKPPFERYKSEYEDEVNPDDFDIYRYLYGEKDGE